MWTSTVEQSGLDCLKRMVRDVEKINKIDDQIVDFENRSKKV
jgi:hypothetical protein